MFHGQPSDPVLHISMETAEIDVPWVDRSISECVEGRDSP